jgi:hypothetical protein
VKIGAQVVADGRYLVFQMAEGRCPASCSGASSIRSPSCARLRWRDADPEQVPPPRSPGRPASAACPTTGIRGRSSRGARRQQLPDESGHNRPEIACRTRPNGPTQRPQAGVGPLIWEMSAKMDPPVGRPANLLRRSCCLAEPAAIVLLIMVSYYPMIHAGYIWDDDLLPHKQSLATISPRPSGDMA